MRRNKVCAFALCAWLVPSGPVTAQQAAPTVATLIETIKAQREQALHPRLAPEQGKTSTLAIPAAPHAPLLWSVAGVDDDLSAVLVIDRKVYTVHRHSLPQRAGPWLVRHMDADKVCMHQGPRTVCLTPPDKNASVLPFLQALRPALGLVSAPTAATPAETADDTLARALATRLPALPVTAGEKK
jgi:hypothetical protein